MITLPVTVKPGQRVTFDDAHEGPQAGAVIDVVPNILNGQSTAVIEVDYCLPGVVWHVPVVDLTFIGATA
jgi:hypothetical protein